MSSEPNTYRFGLWPNQINAQEFYFNRKWFVPMLLRTVVNQWFEICYYKQDRFVFLHTLTRTCPVTDPSGEDSRIPVSSSCSPSDKSSPFRGLCEREKNVKMYSQLIFERDNKLVIQNFTKKQLWNIDFSFFFSFFAWKGGARIFNTSMQIENFTVIILM